MRKVDEKDFSPGMIVSREVVSSEGMVLLEKGAVLTPALISILRRRDVKFIYIQGEQAN